MEVQLFTLVMMPLWMNLLGYKFLQNIHDSKTVCVPYDKIIYSIVGFIIPLLIGVLLARFKPNLATRARKVCSFVILNMKNKRISKALN